MTHEIDKKVNLANKMKCLFFSCIDYPFLVGRALFTASRFPKLIERGILETMISATGAALQPNQNQIIRISAMKATYW